MTVSLKQIRYFVAAAEAQKVSAAAIGLGISQSAVTVAIKELEVFLGVALIHRRIGGIGLTQDGLKFLNYAKNIESNLADAIHSMKNKEAEASGKFRLGVTYTGVGYFLLPILARFKRSYPNVEVEMIEMTRIQLEQAIGEGDVDLALLIVSNLSKGHGLKYKVLMKSPRVLWLSSGHRLNRLPEISLQDLKSETFVQFISDEAITSARKYLTKIGFNPKVILKTTSMEAVRGMVATGAAVTILASLVYRPWSLDGGRVELRSLKESIPSLDLGVAWRSDKVLSEAETKFLDYLRSEGTLPAA
jgi:DNA-binding transcriptional LysR family regulator